MAFEPRCDGRMTSMNAKNLTKEYPCSPYAELEGFPWLPRLIDKVRAKHAGTLGAYIPYPCGSDKRFLVYFGLSPEALEALITSGASDAEVAAWCKEHAEKGPEKAGEYRKAQLAPIAAERRPMLEESIKELKAERPDLDFTGADNFAKMICIEEGHPIPPAV